MTKARWYGVAVWSALLVSGCSGAEDPAREENQVLVAYSALIAEAAQCAADVGACVSSAQGDATALQACRAELVACAQIGAGAVASLATGAATCGLDMRDCVTGGDDPVECKDELLACLGLGALTIPGADAGSEPDSAPSAAPDCLVELHACISGGQPPMTCAEGVRACVVDALPDPASIVPPPPPVAPGAGATPVPPDVSTALPQPAGSAIGCLQAAQACVSGGGAPDGCLADLQACMGDMP
jgi:hypothetical protein